MSRIVELYKQHFWLTEKNSDADLDLIKYNQTIFVGKSKEGDVVVAVFSSNPNQGAISRRTAMVSVECNMHMRYLEEGKTKEGILHLIKCFSRDEKEIDLFLETALLLINKSNATKDDIVEVFLTLASFFNDSNEPSDNELTGLYGELFSIREFNEEIKLGDYWQSRDKLKFDFSISDNTKVEVKTTTKAQRIHHFKHDQLAVSMYNIIILSYMLRHDDEGLSLLELINICKPMLESNHKRLIKLNAVLKNVDYNRLSSIRFEEELTRRNLKIFRGENVPKFTEAKPEGVANAEYDCDFENATSISREEFISDLRDIINQQQE